MKNSARPLAQQERLWRCTTEAMSVGASVMSLKALIGLPCARSAIQLCNSGMCGDTTLARRKMPTGAPRAM